MIRFETYLSLPFQEVIITADDDGDNLIVANYDDEELIFDELKQIDKQRILTQLTDWITYFEDMKHMDEQDRLHPAHQDIQALASCLNKSNSWNK